MPLSLTSDSSFNAPGNCGALLLIDYGPAARQRWVAELLCISFRNSLFYFVLSFLCFFFFFNELNWVWKYLGFLTRLFVSFLILAVWVFFLWRFPPLSLPFTKWNVICFFHASLILMKYIFSLHSFHHAVSVFLSQEKRKVSYVDCPARLIFQCTFIKRIILISRV